MLPFAVSLRFIVLIWTGLQSYEALITCEAGTFEAGEPAFVTCNFRTNITGSRRSINMARYPKDAPKDAIGTDILLCRWSQKKNDHLCFLEGGNYAFDNILTDRLTVKIPAVSLDQEGLYLCFFVPPEGTDSHTCELTVVPDKTEESHDLLPIVLPAVIVPLVVIGIVGLVFFLCRRRLQRARGNESHPDEFIPLQRRQPKTLLDGFQLSKQALQKVMQLLDQQMSKGLVESTKPAAEIKMFNTFVSPLPDESASGECLVVSLDHGSIKVFLVELENHHAEVQSERYSIPQNIRRSTDKELFEFIADRIKTFVQTHKVSDGKLPLAVIVAFPSKHESLHKACLTKWTKEFYIKGVVGKDLHALLQDALQAIRIGSEMVLPGRRFDPLGKVEIVAVANDTVSTLVSVALRDSDCKICLMVDSGLNACYVEDVKHVETDCPEGEKPHEMIINTELGALGENGCLDFCRTEFDKELDEHSSQPGTQILEKMLSGTYIGEIVRLVLERLTKDGVLFRDTPLGCTLFQRTGFSFEYVMMIERDTEEANLKASGILDSLGVLDYTDNDLKTVRLVCKSVCERAAYLTGASLAALINRINQPDVTVVVDGSLYRRHSRFQDLMYSKTLELVKPGLQFHLVSPRGPAAAVGAARIAVTALRSRNTGTASALSKDELDRTLPGEKDNVKSPQDGQNPVLPLL
ncbi:hexokinase type 2-like isoform X2 [Littorina saxatilis]|uniref:hexokinase type 2-like isoform X2 n=1 Tax=Littorina saxatilis TaxID=31220 RepID=UPI0038B5E4FC